MVSLTCLDRAIYDRIRIQGEIRWRIEVAAIKGRGTYQRSRVEGVTDLSPPSLTPGILRLGSCQGRSCPRKGKKEGFCQEDTGVKGVPFKMVFLLTPVSLLQVYFILTSPTIQGLYLCWVAFVQRLILNRSSSPLNYKFFPPTQPRYWDTPVITQRGGGLSQPGTLSLVQIVIFPDSLDTQGLGKGNIPVVLDNVVNTYGCCQHVTIFLRDGGGIGLTDPWWIVRDCWSFYQLKN